MRSVERDKKDDEGLLMRGEGPCRIAFRCGLQHLKCEERSCIGQCQVQIHLFCRTSDPWKCVLLRCRAIYSLQLVHSRLEGHNLQAKSDIPLFSCRDVKIFSIVIGQPCLYILIVDLVW
jgi:hypothetical protein